MFPLKNLACKGLMVGFPWNMARPQIHLFSLNFKFSEVKPQISHCDYQNLQHKMHPEFWPPRRIFKTSLYYKTPYIRVLTVPLFTTRAGAMTTRVHVLTKMINMNILKTWYSSTPRVLIFQCSYSSVWYKTQFGSQTLATKFGNHLCTSWVFISRQLEMAPSDCNCF